MLFPLLPANGRGPPVSSLKLNYGEKHYAVSPESNLFSFGTGSIDPYLFMQFSLAFSRGCFVPTGGPDGQARP